MLFMCLIFNKHLFQRKFSNEICKGTGRPLPSDNNCSKLNK